MRPLPLLTVSLIALAVATTPARAEDVAAAVAPRPLWLADADLQALRHDPERSAALLRHCERESAAAAQPVETFEPPPHYSAKGASETDVSKHLAGDGNIAWRAALCYAASGDVRFARHAQSILSAWGDTLASVRSEQGASEMNFDVPTYVLAASLVRGVADWDDASFRRLLTRVALPASHIGRKNNHANWGVLLDATIAAYLGDDALLARARARWLELMDSQVAADGSLPLEICRSDTNDWCGGPHQGINGLSYTHYTLMPTTAAARVFEMQGHGVWQTPQGQKLASAYRRAAAWTLHPDQFPYYERNAGALNGVRNAAYFALLQRIYPDDDGAQVLAQGSLGLNALEWTTVFR
jgi:hypothetical protein